MARYMIEASGNPQMFAALAQNPQDRMQTQASQEMMAKLRGKMIAYYYTVGSPKYWVIMEFADPVDSLAVEALFVASFGGGTITSLNCIPILTSAEMVDALKRAGELGYRPPSA